MKINLFNKTVLKKMDRIADRPVTIDRSYMIVTFLEDSIYKYILIFILKLY